VIVDISAGLLNTVWKTVLDFTGGRTRRRFSMSYRLSPEHLGPIGIAAPRTLSTVACRAGSLAQGSGVRISLVGRPQ
jgi:hypothetical protein